MKTTTQKLNFPEYEFKITQGQQGSKIFDIIRRQYVALTPEEWVRQNMVQYMIHELSYPHGLIAIEKEIKVNDLRKRVDILLYSLQGNPWMIIECKSPKIRNHDDIAFQASIYSRGKIVKYISTTNGINHFCFEMKNGKFIPLKSFPTFSKN